MKNLSRQTIKISLKIKKATPFLAVLAIGMLFLPSYENAYGQIAGETIEAVRTIQGEVEGTFVHFVKICAGENNRVERPNVIISSDSESFREQVNVNLPPGFCSHHGFTVNAKDPSSITAKIVLTTNFN